MTTRVVGRIMKSLFVTLSFFGVTGLVTWGLSFVLSTTELVYVGMVLFGIIFSTTLVYVMSEWKE